jgi:hypothetical protein
MERFTHNTAVLRSHCDAATDSHLVDKAEQEDHDSKIAAQGQDQSHKTWRAWRRMVGEKRLQQSRTWTGVSWWGERKQLWSSFGNHLNGNERNDEEAALGVP